MTSGRLLERMREPSHIYIVHWKSKGQNCRYSGYFFYFKDTILMYMYKNMIVTRNFWRKAAVAHGYLWKTLLRPRGTMQTCTFVFFRYFIDAQIYFSQL